MESRRADNILLSPAIAIQKVCVQKPLRAVMRTLTGSSRSVSAVSYCAYISASAQLGMSSFECVCSRVQRLASGLEVNQPPLFACAMSASHCFTLNPPDSAAAALFLCALPRLDPQHPLSLTPVIHQLSNCAFPVLPLLLNCISRAISLPLVFTMLRQRCFSTQKQLSSWLVGEQLHSKWELPRGHFHIFTTIHSAMTRYSFCPPLLKLFVIFISCLSTRTLSSLHFSLCLLVFPPPLMPLLLCFSPVCLFVLTTHSDFEALSVIACLRLVSHLCNGVKPQLRQVKLDCESPNVCPFCFSLIKAGGSRGLRASLYERRGGEQRGGGRGAHSRRTRQTSTQISVEYCNFFL